MQPPPRPGEPLLEQVPGTGHTLRPSSFQALNPRSRSRQPKRPPGPRSGTRGPSHLPSPPSPRQPPAEGQRSLTQLRELLTPLTLPPLAFLLLPGPALQIDRLGYRGARGPAWQRPALRGARGPGHPGHSGAGAPRGARTRLPPRRPREGPAQSAALPWRSPRRRDRRAGGQTDRQPALLHFRFQIAPAPEVPLPAPPPAVPPPRTLPGSPPAAAPARLRRRRPPHRKDSGEELPGQGAGRASALPGRREERNGVISGFA